MVIDRLALKGVLRFDTQLTLDFRDVPPGLVAIVGENGSGKTTLLESMIAPIGRAFASRPRELFDYATGADSFIETEYSVEGRGVYRARVNLDGPHRSSDATLSQVLPDGRRVLLNDGKSKTFDTAVEREFPSRALLQASAFAAQDQTGSFRTLDKKGKKELFASLLGCDHYETMSGTAKSGATMIETTRTRLLAVRDTLAAQCGSTLTEALARDLDSLTADLADTKIAQGRLRAELADHEATLAAWQEQSAQHEAACREADALNGRVEELRRQRQRTADDLDGIDRTLTTTLRRLDDQTRNALTQIDSRLANNQDLLQRRDAIEAAVQQLARDEAQDAADRARERVLFEQQRVRQTEVQAAEAALAAVIQAASDLRRVEADAETMGQVPCHGVGAYARCQFLARAATAQASIGGLQAEVATMTAVEGRLTTAREALRAVTAQVIVLQTGLTRPRDPSVRASAALAGKLAAATARVDELHAQRTETVAAAARQEATLRQASDERRDAVTATLADLDRALAATMAQEATVRRLAAETRAAFDRAAVARETIGAARLRWDETTARIAQVQSRLDLVRERQAAVTQTRARVAALTARLLTLDQLLLDWAFCARLLHRDGLPTLEIANAGPTVAAYANDLMTACYGGQFSIDLITQEEKVTKSKDGTTTKEVFELKVFDNARAGEARAIEDLSGGQQVIVDEAVKNAIAIFANERSAMPIRTCWRDETTGALDPDNARRYMTMLRRVHQLGGFRHTFFVTHNGESAAAADAQIQIGAGTARIVYAPFTEAA